MAELAHVADDADVLLLAGDLTKCGAHAEAACLARTIAAVDVPVLGVLGNHDYQSDEAPAVAAVAARGGMHLPRGRPRVVDVRGVRVGIAGSKGFGGGFWARAAAISASRR
jgi:predicted phosphodiesterase